MPDATLPDKAIERQRRIRASFIAQGTSLKAWCEERGVKHQNACKAALGTWKGPKAAALIEEMMQATGVKE